MSSIDKRVHSANATGFLSVADASSLTVESADGRPGKEGTTATQRRISVLTLALAAALLLAACTDDDDATATAPPSASTSCADEVPRDLQVSPFVCLDWPRAGATIRAGS
jgi:hypothetical protein